ncbi:MAG: transcriptional regulator [Pseudomonadales bacterium RIFCSPLOWO2_12_59_9]|uniref:SoxR reducing system RseC family protein n=1 Tax=Pseudomonas sp. TaxID=306 RepID=UPI0008CE2990|nr:SoxR reducing system RseC family protein [Pseudomonas sp.]OHC26408.1 MAG: transcriptional regulator [Pseudomonadales bacterium RIFCSPLOWO2_12_59_9]
MIEEPGRVVGLEEGAVWVETLRKSTCSSCSANAGCGQGLLDKLAISSRRGTVRVLTDLQLRVGDNVIIGLREDALLRSSLLVYLLPLLGLFAGALGADYFALGEPWSIAAGLLGLLAAGLLVRGHSRRHADDPALQPVVLRALLGAPLSC